MRPPQLLPVLLVALGAASCGPERTDADPSPRAPEDATGGPRSRRADSWEDHEDPDEELIQAAFDHQLAAAQSRSRGGGSERTFDEGARQIPTRGLGLGRRLPDLELVDLHGDAFQLGELADADAFVILARDSGCPVSRRFGPGIAELERELAKRDVPVLYLYQGEHESAETAREDMERYGCEAPAVYDADGALGRALDVRTTAEAFVFDGARTLVYRGAVDDRLGRGVVRDEAEHDYLLDAVGAVLAGERLVVEATTAPGCIVALGEPPDESQDGSSTDELTYHGTISRIIRRNCEVCHRDGAVAPFSLETHADLKGRRGMIRFVVEEGIMPPWFADEESGPWGNDRRLTERDRTELLAWIEAGCPEGDPADAPLPPRWPDPDEWSIGEPDLVLQAPRPIPIPAEGFLDYQKRVLRIPIEEDRWVRAIEILPTAPEVVHHVGTHLRTPDGKRRAFQGWVPGQVPTEFPDGMALFLPKGSRMLLTIHYTPIGVATEDQLRIGLVFADEPPVQEVLRVVIADRDFVIPPHHPDFPVEAELVLSRPTVLRHLMPHMHLRGKSFTVDAILPDGTEKHLIGLDEWDFDWQLTYELAEPMHLPAGTRLRAVGRFDNSAANPANPNPARAVHYGRQTNSEMMTLGLEVLLAPAAD